MVVKKLTALFGMVKRALVSIHKRDKTLIVYGGALDLFIDNAKHLFIINNQVLPEYRHVWLTRNDEVFDRIRNLGLAVVRSDTREGKRMLYRAGMVIYDNRIDEFAYHDLSEGAVRFNMWHAVQGVKRIGAMHTDPPVPYVIESAFRYRFFMNHVYGDYVLSPSRNLADTMSAAFQVPVENIVISDQPRCQTLYMDGKELDAFVMKYEDEEGKRMYEELKSEDRKKFIYMPTFRDADPEYIYKAIPDWDGFNGFLQENRMVLYLKVHRVTPLPQGMDYSNIRVLDNGLDIYPLLPLFDRLITDYSSIMFEFALLKKPVIIYDYDLKEYSTESRYVFKSFIELLTVLSEAKDSRELMALMTAPDESVRPLPVGFYYDCPGDYSNIEGFVKSKLS